jgi:hypothetical protein
MPVSLCPPGLKHCKICKKCLPIHLYYSDRSQPDGKNRRCKECESARRKKATWAKPEYVNKKLFVEWDYKNYYRRKFNGVVEAETPVGKIDILTRTKLIEIKQADMWKMGVGQLMTMGLHYPDRQKVLILINYIPILATQFSKKEVVEEHCQNLGIEVLVAPAMYMKEDGVIYSH